MNGSSLKLKPLFITGLLFLIISSSNKTETYTLNQFAIVRDSLQIMAESIAQDISREGPLAWLKYFENTPDFFMASEGELVLANYYSATNFIINSLLKTSIKLNRVGIIFALTRLPYISRHISKFS